MADWYQTATDASLAEAKGQMERGEITPEQYYRLELNTLGTYGYMQKYPESTEPGYRWYQDEKYGIGADLQAAWAGTRGGGVPFSNLPQYAEMEGLRELRKQFSGGTGTFIRWMIDNRVGQLQHDVASLRASASEAVRLGQISLGEAEQAALERGELIRDEGRVESGILHDGARYPYPGGDTVGQDRIDRYRAMATKIPSDPSSMGAPVPDWMRQYIDPSVSGERPTGTERIGRDVVPRTATVGEGMLAPLGAQADVTPEQMEEMAGYLAWHKAGSPTRYSEESLLKMADWERHWGEHTKLSESLFPARAQLGQRWATARQ